MRPDNWVKQRTIFFETHQKTNRWGQTRRLDYEAGADAILKAIWKMAKDSPAGTFIFDANTINFDANTINVFGR